MEGGRVCRSWCGHAEFAVPERPLGGGDDQMIVEVKVMGEVRAGSRGSAGKEGRTGLKRSIGCGHNFCRGCVTQLWGKDDEDQAVGATGGWDHSIREVLYQQIVGELFQGPEEGPWVAGGGIRNWDDAWVPEEGDYYRIDIYGEEAGEHGVCSEHQQALKLFCEVDEEAICVVCRESRSHEQHSVVPLEEVEQDYKVSGLH
ncbi:PREDICTED: tripartite motif-containing protein 52 [Myotis davidii]|uniref:tripartite motif-containing protein 52 n=1 Tax=Myotis davidii TaxID=225400 RepID=UPI0003EBEA19|nr:PREDICTED: tripartite motif-containing protein 52 [Myotis davidii]